MSARTAIYRCFDADDELLYVGIAFDPDARWEQHKTKSPWAKQVSMRTIEWLEDRKDAERAEREAIRFEEPRYNQRHNGRQVAAMALAWRTSNPLADAVGEPSDEQLRRVVALLGLRQLSDDVST